MLGTVTQRLARLFADRVTQPAPIDVFTNVLCDIAGRSPFTWVDKL